jgi:uncharacterized membrane protein required for colicin V production
MLGSNPVVMIAALDNTPGQVAFDALLVVVVIVNIYLGLRFGLLRRVVAFAGVYLGLFAATNIGNGLAGLVSPHSVYANAWAYIGVFAVVVIAFEILGHLFNDRLQLIAVVLFNRLSGVLAGAAVGIAEVLVVFLVALALGGVPVSANNGVDPNRNATAKDIQDANLSSLVVRLAPEARFVFAPALPGDFSAHLAQSVVPATPPH